MDYERIKLNAAKSIKRAGKRVYVVVRERIGGTPRNPVYGNAYHPAWAVELNQRLKNLDGSLAPGVAHTMMISTEGLDIKIDNTHMISLDQSDETASYSILDVRPLQPGEVILLWEVDLGG